MDNFILVKERSELDEVLRYGRHVSKEDAKQLDRDFKIMCVGIAVLTSGIAHSLVRTLLKGSSQ